MTGDVALAPPKTLVGPAAVEARGLVVRYGRRVALDGVDVSLAAGECLALFGPNGAGKTTLLRVLAGLRRASAGTVQIAGQPVAAIETRAITGLISHKVMLYPALTARENVAFFARLHGVAQPERAAMAALERLGVADRAETAVRALSRGLMQRVAIARAIVHAPRLLLADEPYTGLDASGAAALTRVLEGLVADGAALVLVTHQVNEGLALAHEAMILQGGRILRREPAAGLDPTQYAAHYREIIGAA
jgi:heme ABC exporter ATP-binding subunit CcmA